MKNYLRDFWLVLGDGRHALPMLGAMMFCLALLDLLGLGLIAPLIVSIAGPTDLSRGILPTMLVRLISVDLKVIALLVLAVFTVKMVAGYKIQKELVRFSELQRGRLMIRLMAAIFEKPYEYYLQRNSADIVNSIAYTTWTFSTGTLSPALRLLTDTVMFGAIVGFLVWMNWVVVLLLGMLLLAVVTAYMRMVRRKLAHAGETVTESYARTIQDVNQSVGGFREIRILGVEQYCLEKLRTHTTQLAEGNALYLALSAIPRYLMEWTLVVGLISVFVFVSMMNLPPGMFVPIMGLVAVAAIRLMPGVTSIMAAVNSLRMNHYGLRQMADDLRQIPVGHPDPIPSRRPAMHDASEATVFRSLRFDAVTYRYAGAPRAAIAELSFEIKAGQAVGLIGRSGSGKSTTADVLLGLLEPQQGAVLVNDEDIRKDPRRWMARVAYIPQQIFLSDESLLQNIAFGTERAAVDMARVHRAVQTAQLEEVVRQMPDGLNTIIGERGVRLSGGQRQRVALARAFYHDRDIIVMDEATASLDHETEQEIVSAIHDLHGKKTLIIIAHRLSTLEGCDLVLRLESGRVAQSGDFKSVIGVRGAPYFEAHE
jgi:ATP-binding cassette, subfamily B, bacterial PglK